MKCLLKYCSILCLLSAISMVLSCSSGNKFKIDGQLLNMDQGDILVYSNTKLFSGLDTIHIIGGRFTYERRIESNGTIVLVFPNFSEVPVFAEPGEEVVLKGNAQQLNAMTINGTKDNEAFTQFRVETKEMNPAETKSMAEKFIEKNGSSPASVWLLEKHFVKTSSPDYKKAYSICKKLKKSQKDNPLVGNLLISLEKIYKNYKTKGKLPKFSAKDIDDKTIDNKYIEGKITIIYTSASWDYSNSLDSKVRSLMYEDKKFNAVKISIDPYRNKVKKDTEYQDKKPIIICDEKMFNSPLMKTLGFTGCGENILVDEKGNILERNIKPYDLNNYIK